MHNSTAKIGVLLVNLGTPDSPSVSDVRKYLREFLMDARVIDIPFLSRFLLVNLIIAPFRAPKSAKIYKEVWTENGSPLKYFGERVTHLLQNELGTDFQVVLGMRYQNPSIIEALNQLKDKGLEKIIVIPLFPQYASATTGSVQEKIMQIVKTWQIIPEMVYVQSFFEHPQFVEAFVKIGQKYLQNQTFDHIIFSYHGLPERQILKGDHTGTCLKEAYQYPEKEGEANCCATLHAHNRTCYRAQCFATSRLLAEELGLKPENYTVCFQSRLGKSPWLKPYTEDIVKKLVKEGKKKVLAFSPSFVADCLETTIEIGEEYKEVFLHEGGEYWQMVESLNDNHLWVLTLKNIIELNAQLLPKKLAINLTEKMEK